MKPLVTSSKWRMDLDDYIASIVFPFLRNIDEVYKVHQMIMMRDLGINDWLVRSKNGELYSVRDKEFRETYEECE